ncbi:hypothetical protein GCM10009869_06320 [Amnibacterium kyonggiense]
MAGDGDPKELGLRGGSRQAARQGRRRRPWVLATAGSAALATVIAVGGAVIGVGATPALAVCDSSGGSCIDTASSTSASVAILPLAKAGDDTLTVSNTGAAGQTEVGVVGYLTSTDPSASAVTAAGPSTSATVRVEQDQRRHVRLTGVPATARAVIVQVGSSYARSSWQKSRAACATTGSASAKAVSDRTTDADPVATPVDCGWAQVTFSGRHDKVTRGQVLQALRAWAKRTATALPTAQAATDIAQSVADPATLAAAIAPGVGSMTVSWRLDQGSQHVDAVRITRSGANGATNGGTTVDKPAGNGSVTLKGLTAGSMYTVTIATVIDGTAGSPISMTASAFGRSTSSAKPSTSPSASPSPSASASASPSPSPSDSTPPAGGSGGSSGTGLPGADAYPGWTRVIGQDFDADAGVGSFASKYSGWAGYDGNTSGASGTTWNSSTTMSVSDSVLRMRNWVSNGKAQAGALTPVTSGTPWHAMGQVYGKYVVRFKADSVRGFKVAWLLWPTSNDWNQGEIDFPEANLDGTVNYAAHNVTGIPSDQQWGSAGTKMGDGSWHTATTTWEPGKVTFDLDGQTVKVITSATYLPTSPMRWALQNETSTDGTKPSSGADGSVYIDWVAQYKRG